MSRVRSSDFDVIVIGAGIVGAAMASYGLTRGTIRAGRLAMITDRLTQSPAPTADWNLRVYAVNRASQRLLQASGSWSALPKDLVFPYERMCVWDANGLPQGPGSLLFDCAEIGEANLGHIVDGSALQWHCLQAARKAGAVIIEGSVQTCIVDDERILVRLTDGREFQSRLVAAADGTESPTRELLGIGVAGHLYSQDALIAHVRTSVPHGNTAWQRFLPTGPLAFLPLSDGRSSVVWSVQRTQAERLRAMSSDELGKALTAASGEVLGECRLTTPLASFPLKLQYALQYARPRAVLLGDAAHVVHPLAGQGLNLGLMDCGALDQVLGEADGASSFGDLKVLRRYERWRRSENILAATALDGMERLFSGDGTATSSLRGASLSAVERIGFLKRRLAQRALGVAGDIPNFLRGEAV